MISALDDVGLTTALFGTAVNTIAEEATRLGFIGVWILMPSESTVTAQACGRPRCRLTAGSGPGSTSWSRRPAIAARSSPGQCSGDAAAERCLTSSLGVTHGRSERWSFTHGGKVRSAGVRAGARHLGEDGCPAGFEPGDGHPRR